MAESKLRNVSWPCPTCNVPEDATKEGTWAGGEATGVLNRLLDSWLEPPSSLLDSWQKSPAWTEHMARYQQLADRLQAESKRTAWPLQSYDINTRATFGE